tara:strand:- start:533 stop:652 length:120 start_codon:yes stop_codon:yes gene_type:complete
MINHFNPRVAMVAIAANAVLSPTTINNYLGLNLEINFCS